MLGIRSLPRRCVSLLAVGAIVAWPALAAADPSDPLPASAAELATHPGNAGAAADKGLVPGYFDAATGTFQKLDPQAGTVTYNGTIKIVGTIELNPGIPMSAAVSVFPLFTTSYATTMTSVIGASVTAKRTGAHTATFTVSVPYTTVVPKGDAQANVAVIISTSAPGADGTTISWNGGWGTIVSLPKDGKTLTVKANGAV